MTLLLFIIIFTAPPQVLGKFTVFWLNSLKRIALERLFAFQMVIPLEFRGDLAGWRVEKKIRIWRGNLRSSPRHLVLSIVDQKQTRGD